MTFFVINMSFNRHENNIVSEYLLLLVGLEEKHHGQYIDENFLDSGWSCAAHASFASPAQE